MSHATLFTSPKQGGILQSSGFLDLPSLMALSRTCKAHALDELSLLLWIENEVTRTPKCYTMEEIIYFLRELYRGESPSWLKRWLKRDDDDHAITVTRDMLSEAVVLRYEVMVDKMLRTVPLSQLFPMVRERDHKGEIMLHLAARSGKIECTATILDRLYPERERLRAVSTANQYGETVLHCAAQSSNIECFNKVLSIYPESERVQAVNRQDNIGMSVLHCAAESRTFECVKTILALYADATERLHAVSQPDKLGRNVLHCAARSDNIKCIKAALSLYPESQRQAALHIQTRSGKSVLDLMCVETSTYIMEWLSKLQLKS